MNCIFNQRAKDRPRSYDVIRRCMDSPALWTSPCWHVISGHSKNIIVSAAHCLRRHKMYNSNVALFAEVNSHCSDVSECSNDAPDVPQYSTVTNNVFWSVSCQLFLYA